MGISDWYCTPPKIETPLFEFNGGPVGTDPCSNEYSIVRAMRRYTAAGLHLPWGDGKRLVTAYENPPYSGKKLGLWTDKGLEELRAHRINELVRCVPVSTSTDWWLRMALFERFNPRLIFTKRISFLYPKRGSMKSRKTDSARHETVLIYYGRRTRQFDKAFDHIAMWKAWGR